MRRLLIAWIVCESIFLFIWELQLVWILIEEFSYSFSNKTTVICVCVYFIIYTALYYSYAINLAYRALPKLTQVSDLEPIGKGITFIFDHFKTHPKSGAMLAIMAEIVRKSYLNLISKLVLMFFISL